MENCADLETRTAAGFAAREPALAPVTEPAPSSCCPLISGRYVILEELGRGGTGVVYLSWDLVLRRTVAIKVLQRDLLQCPGASDALRHEAVMTIDLHHEGIVRAYHFQPWEEPFGPYIVMEYVPWASGEKWVPCASEAGLPLWAVVEAGVRLCAALAYAHDRGVLHGDIKPTNVFVDPSGERAKLADFGLARVLGGTARRTLQLRASGTPAYMAPEQREPGARLGPATDIYLLAETLWTFLAGEPPCFGPDPRPTSPERTRLIDVLRQALNPDPAARPASAPEFARRLDLLGVLPA